MGTRADFYVGRGANAEWIGSIAYDGYEGGEAGQLLLSVTSEADFRAKVAQLSKRDDFTSPERGWPWTWEDSRTTDFAYAWDGQTWCSLFGYGWRTLVDMRIHAAEHQRWAESDDEEAPEPELWDRTKTAVFPDMTDRQRVTLGKRSGVLVVKG